MAFATLELTHPATGIKKKSPIGFSWTTLFFGPFPAFFRGDWAFGFIMIISAFFTFGISSLIFPFIYNKMYFKKSVEGGYVVSASSKPIDIIASKLNMRVPVGEVV